MDTVYGSDDRSNLADAQKGPGVRTRRSAQGRGVAFGRQYACTDRIPIRP